MIMLLLIVGVVTAIEMTILKVPDNYFIGLVIGNLIICAGTYYLTLKGERDNPK